MRTENWVCIKVTGDRDYLLLEQFRLSEKIYMDRSLCASTELVLSVIWSGASQLIPCFHSWYYYKLNINHQHLYYRYLSGDAATKSEKIGIKNAVVRWSNNKKCTSKRFFNELMTSSFLNWEFCIESAYLIIISVYFGCNNKIIMK